MTNTTIGDYIGFSTITENGSKRIEAFNTSKPSVAQTLPVTVR